ncbi:MAG: hypothetical protein MUF81_11000 [Verrucomicrobia bacterium]|jgi:hypothetical protein|nr:hypothetical protein [Verrucomicrobiota bacterium]
MKHKPLLLTALLLAPLAALHASALVNLRCEYQGNPLAKDTVRARSSWILYMTCDIATYLKSGKKKTE